MWYSTIGSIVALILSLLVVPLAAAAQPAGKVSGALGTLTSGSGSIPEAFRQGLRDLGYVEGQNIVIEHRAGKGIFESLPGFAAELVRLPVDVIVTAGTPAALAAKAGDEHDPHRLFKRGRSGGQRPHRQLAQPGGNITGLSALRSDLNTGNSSSCSRRWCQPPPAWPCSSPRTIPSTA